jgi:hypothetical protein
MSDVQEKTAVDISKLTEDNLPKLVMGFLETFRPDGSSTTPPHEALIHFEDDEDGEIEIRCIGALKLAPKIVRAVNHHDELVAALRDVTNFAEAQICTHENTRRGGVIWTICDDCGAKFADDEGGPPTPKVFKPIARARALLSKVSEQ